MATTERVRRASGSEHMIEHLSWQQAAVCIRETFRVLEPAAASPASAHPTSRRSVALTSTATPRSCKYLRADYDAPTHAHLPNLVMHEHGHRFVFDFDALRLLLEQAGFVEIERAEPGQSRHAVVRATDSHTLGDLSLLVLTVDAVDPRHLMQTGG